MGNNHKNIEVLVKDLVASLGSLGLYFRKSIGATILSWPLFINHVNTRI
jgi:hypothetical protein